MNISKTKLGGFVISHFLSRRDGSARRKAPELQYVLHSVSAPQRWIISFYDFIKLQTANCKMGRLVIPNFAFFILYFAFASASFAVPETSSVRVTDVTPSSFSVVWITDVAADPTVEVYAEENSYDSLFDENLVNISDPESSGIYVAVNTGGSMENYAVTGDANKILTWIQQGAMNN